MSALYREIDEKSEFRGDGYFNAIWANGQTWLSATPPRWKFAIYPNDRLILKDIGNGDYVIMGMGVDDRWGIPLPEYQQDVEYRVFRDCLKDIVQREVIA